MRLNTGQIVDMIITKSGKSSSMCNKAAESLATGEKNKRYHQFPEGGNDVDYF